MHLTLRIAGVGKYRRATISAGRVDPDKLADIEALEFPAKAVKLDPNAGTTLALAWTAIARHNASRAATRTAFDARMAALELAPEIAERIRPMVDIGSFQAGLK